MSDSLNAEYFDQLYDTRQDPWDFETSDYERKKYAHTLKSLPRKLYPHAFEIGCSIGVLTEQLSKHCGALLAVDVAEAALAQARARCTNLKQVEFRRMCVPGVFPDGDFDLILVSEVAYYLSRPDLKRLADQMAAHQPIGSDLVLVHFTPKVADYPSSGDQVHEYLLGRTEWMKLEGSREDRYRIDVLRRVLTHKELKLDSGSAE